MTIELVREKRIFLGLIKRSQRLKVLDYRSWREIVSPNMVETKEPDAETLHFSPIVEGGKNPKGLFQFLYPLSDEKVLVVTKTKLFCEGEKVVYSGEQINRVSLKNTDGETIRYRRTKRGDYPPLKPGQIEIKQTVIK